MNYGENPGRLAGPSGYGRIPALTPAMARRPGAMSPGRSRGFAPRALLVSLYLLAYALFASIYVALVSPSWAYMGFVTDVASLKLGIGAFVLAAFAAFTPPNLSVRGLLLNMLLTVYVVPSLVIFGCADKPIMAALVVCLGVATVYVVSAIRVAPFRLLNASPIEIMWALAIAAAAVIGLFYLGGGFRYFNLNLTRVYDFRTEATSALPGLFGYVASAMSKVIIPFGLAASLFYKKRNFTIYFILISVLFFGLTSNRSVLFAPVVFWGVFTFMKNYKTFYVPIIAYVVLLVLGGIDSAIAASDPSMSFMGWFESLFVRRALLLPPLLDYNYMEFFSSNPKYFWSESRLTLGMASNPYGGLAPPRLIGEVYFGNAATSANAGFIGSGFAQAGLVGTLIYAAGAGLVIALCDAYGRHLGRGLVAAAMMGQYAALITSTDFLTLFLTHGLLLALIILALMRPPASDGDAGPAAPRRVRGRGPESKPSGWAAGRLAPRRGP